MKDIQVTLDTFKKFTGNIFMIDNIPEISIGGNANGDCEFETELSNLITLGSGGFDSGIIENWDVYLTSVFIGGYKMEQLAQPGSLFENRYRWNGNGEHVLGGPKQYKNALGNIDLGRNDTSGNEWDGTTTPTYDDWLKGAQTNAADKNLATQSMLYKSGRIGGYMGISALTGHAGAGLPSHAENGTGNDAQTIFKDESIQSFVISIKDQKGLEYMPRNSFVGAYPKNYKNWLAFRGIKSFGWTTTPSDDLEEGTTGHKGTPEVITAGLVLMNNQKQRNDGFKSVGGATNQPEDQVVDYDDPGTLTVQDYVPFIYDERENNPIYLTTLNPGDEVSKLNVKITDQNGNSIWGPAHVSQMKNDCGIDANPPTNSRRIIIKLTYKPKIKNKLEQEITKLNKNIEKLIDSFENPNYKTSSLNVENPTYKTCSLNGS